MQGNRVFFLFPQEARGKKWLSKLPVPDANIFFSSFEPKELYKTCRKLSKEFSSENTVIHTHFVEAITLLPVTSCFKTVIVHYHMFVPKVDKLRRFLKKILMNLIYRNAIVVVVSEAVTHDIKNYYYFCTHK